MDIRCKYLAWIIRVPINIYALFCVCRSARCVYARELCTAKRCAVESRSVLRGRAMGICVHKQRPLRYFWCNKIGGRAEMRTPTYTPENSYAKPWTSQNNECELIVIYKTDRIGLIRTRNIRQEGFGTQSLHCIVPCTGSDKINIWVTFNLSVCCTRSKNTRTRKTHSTISVYSHWFGDRKLVCLFRVQSVRNVYSAVNYLLNNAFIHTRVAISRMQLIKWHKQYTFAIFVTESFITFRPNYSDLFIWLSILHLQCIFWFWFINFEISLHIRRKMQFRRCVLHLCSKSQSEGTCYLNFREANHLKWLQTDLLIFLLNCVK